MDIVANEDTVRRQIQHMIKYRYVPFSFGKAKYTKNSSWSILHQTEIFGTFVGEMQDVSIMMGKVEGKPSNCTKYCCEKNQMHGAS